ncbi:HIT domain-containing protein [Candidatus Woesearchaeota archaeon]|nr:HIT domain-containing protein [Candidatus Woesearchaeota archaeon]
MSEKPCGLCLAYNEDIRLVHRNDYAFGAVPTTPICLGHIIVVPKRHVQRFHELPPNELSAYFELRDQIVDRLMELHPDMPPLVGQNNGKWSTQPHAHEQIAPSRGHFKELLYLRDFLEGGKVGNLILAENNRLVRALGDTPKETLEEMASKLRF